MQREYSEIKTSLAVLISMVRGRRYRSRSHNHREGRGESEKDLIMKSTFLDNIGDFWEAAANSSSSSSCCSQEEDPSSYLSTRRMEFFLHCVGLSEYHYKSKRSTVGGGGDWEEQISSVKELMLEMFDHLIDGDFDHSRRRAIVRRISFAILSKHLVAIFTTFNRVFSAVYTSKSANLL